MMEAMLNVAAVAVTAAILSVTLRKQTPEIALVLGIGAGLCCLGLAAEGVGAALQLLEELIVLIGVDEVLLAPVGKVVALSLVSRVTAELCRGAGEQGIAAFVETAGTVLALGVSLPLIRGVALLMGELLG